MSQVVGRFFDKICFLEEEDPSTISLIEHKVRSFIGLSFRACIAVFFSWHCFDFLFSAVWMHGYVWSLNLPIDLDLSDKSAGSIVYHQKSVVGQNERLYHAFAVVSATFLTMLCSGFGSRRDLRIWELMKLCGAMGLLVATVRACQLKHRLFSALHEGFYCQFVMFFVGIMLAIRSKELSGKEDNQKKTEDPEKPEKQKKND